MKIDLFVAQAGGDKSKKIKITYLLSMCKESLKRSTCFGGSFFLSTARFLNTILGDDFAGSATETEVLATAATGPVIV